MFTLYENTFPYSKAYLRSDKYATIAQSLFDKLPHGSGINGTWHITQSKHKSNVYYASCDYEAMNENGYYCHVYHFTFALVYNGKGKSVLCPYCHNEYNDKPGYRSFPDMARYKWTLERFVNYPDSNGVYIPCLACHTTGYLPISEWEVLRLNFHGQREYNCCGYGLKDYLYQLMTECL